jgi:hypothetical protein
MHYNVNGIIKMNQTKDNDGKRSDETLQKVYIEW